MRREENRPETITKRRDQTRLRRGDGGGHDYEEKKIQTGHDYKKKTERKDKIMKRRQTGHDYEENKTGHDYEEKRETRHRTHIAHDYEKKTRA